MLVCVASVNFIPLFRDLAYFNEVSNGNHLIRYITIAKGVTFILYPLLGLLADLVFSRYKVIAAGLVMISAGLLTLSIIALALILTGLHTGIYFVLLACGMIPIGVTVLSFGMVEANALQFGMDQLTEASGEQLSRFVHWYFWVVWLGQFLFNIASALGLFVFVLFLAIGYLEYSKYYMIGGAAVISAILLVISSVVICVKKHYLNTARISRNSLQNIFLVLKYSWQHTFPENRSAFTYWEEDIPARIDFGKNKYGGPFTNEEVEDVKTFFHMLVLLLSLFGSYLTGDTFSTMQQLELQQGCP